MLAEPFTWPQTALALHRHQNELVSVSRSKPLTWFTLVNINKNKHKHKTLLKTNKGKDKNNNNNIYSLVVDRRNYSRIFQFPLRINVKISEHAPNFNVFKPRLVCGRIFNLALGSSGNSQKSEILKNLKFSKI